MIDIDLIRANPARLDAMLRARGSESLPVLELDQHRREATQALQGVQERRNALSKEIGEAMRAGDTHRATALRNEVTDIKQNLPVLEENFRRWDDALKSMVSALPNFLADDVPFGADETANQPVETHEATYTRRQGLRTHDEIGAELGMMDFASAAAMAGSRFVILSGALARMERALGQFMLDMHTTQHGYREVSPPLLVRPNALYGTGQLPKFLGDLYTVSTIGGEERAIDSRTMLIPTAEVPLTNLAAGRILDPSELPLRYTALTPCFRSEAGSAGRDTRGMLRQHQFMKCELVSIVVPEDSDAEHERMMAHAKAVLIALDLPFRVVRLCSGDTGFSAARTYDLEVWLPSSGEYREISSVSTCRDFQARRMDARVRRDGKLMHVHTLNGSGVAVGRALLAVMENYQMARGFRIPEALQSYLGGLTEIV
jgi:seryl-tRNA synthetase